MQEVVRTSRPAKVATATAADADRCLEILTLAFANDPAARWMFPDLSEYLRSFPHFIRACGQGSFESGASHWISGCATALWLPPGLFADEEALAGLVHRSVDASRRKSVLAVLDQMDQYRPRRPHWHLPFLGVDPLRQRKGYGSMLLRHMLPRLDLQSAAVYLEATSVENVALYERYGFEVVGVIQAGSSPSIFPMLRKPTEMTS